MRILPAFTLTLALALPAVALAPRLSACVWDYDTLATELKGVPEVREVAAGIFDRQPDLYYEMRLKRLATLLEESPDDLDALDGIAVANDRLGKSDRAIAWMAKKNEALTRLKYDEAKYEQPDHRYRYYANLGTFYAHRWFKGGRDFSKLDDLTQAIELIEKAIEHNPDAHFGRETYQLKALTWVKETASSWDGQGKFPDMLNLMEKGQFYFDSDNDQLKKLGLEDSITALSGIIVQGAAWQSVDVFHALSLALMADGKHVAGFYVRQRVIELVNGGATSIVKGAPVGDALLKKTAVYSLVDGPDQKPVIANYKAMREYGEKLEAARLAYMLPKLQAGEHPDTHADFWEKFEAPERPKLDGEASAAQPGDADSESDGESDQPKSRKNSPAKGGKNNDDAPPTGEGKWGAPEERKKLGRDAPREGAEPRKQSERERQGDDRQDDEKRQAEGAERKAKQPAQGAAPGRDG